MAENTNSSLIRDNRGKGNVGGFLEERIIEGCDMSIVSAYFTIYAYNALKKNLDKIEHLRFLFGEPNFVNMSEGKNPAAFRITDDALEISNKDKICQRSIARECAEWIKSKAEIRSLIKPNFLHGKMYFIKADRSGYPCAITGSSNFTAKGLGLSASNNMELNLIVDSDTQRQNLSAWFNELWDNKDLVRDVKDEVLRYLEVLYKDETPHFVYLKTLYALFADGIADENDEELFRDVPELLESKIWNTLYEFQKAGVRGAIKKLEKYNGCIIADSVGLGKTYEALAVIKYFETKGYRVLVLCPKKLSGNWTVYQGNKNNALNPLAEDDFRYHVLYHTDMGRVKGKSDADGDSFAAYRWDRYNMVVIDESHNFRGDPAEKTNEDGTQKMNRASWLLNKVILAGQKSSTRSFKVLLLSATPVNTSLRDLRNQINLMTRINPAALQSIGINDIWQTLAGAQTKFTRWAERKGAKNRKELMESLDASFYLLMNTFTIARSRHHITNNYDISSIGHFPKREKPISLFSPIDSCKDARDAFPPYEKVDGDISGYKLSLFNPSAYVKESAKKKYMNSEYAALSQSYREESLIGMMKMNFMKRLESSVHAFSLSLSRTIEKIDALEKKIERYEAAREDVLLDSEDGSDELEEDDGDFEAGSKLKFSLADLDCKRWKEDLKRDKEALAPLQARASKVTAERDAKLAMLKKFIKERMESASNKKIIIFTAFSDTAQYLYDNLKDWAKEALQAESAAVTGSRTCSTTGLADFEMVLLNFAPIAKRRDAMPAMAGKEMKDIDLLIATDCISEGQNLQDCSCLINYDIHWNPVRIIQRFGRIDRIGSPNKSIQLVNFWPTEELDKYLNLKTRVVTRMTLVDVAATANDNVLAEEEINEKNYRDEQLERLKKEVLDIEELGTSVTLSDFSLDTFRDSLREYLKEDEKLLRESENGIYAVVPHNEGAPAGAVFCLRQKNDETLDGAQSAAKGKGQIDAMKRVNPLSPYFLVYVTDDGEVRLTYAQAKEILDLMRALCEGKKEIYKDLCDAFNAETHGGLLMGKYFLLLQNAVSAITESTKKRAAASLTSGRGGLLIGSEHTAVKLDGYELFTWLAVR